MSDAQAGIDVLDELIVLINDILAALLARLLGRTLAALVMAVLAPALESSIRRDQVEPPSPGPTPAEITAATTGDARATSSGPSARSRRNPSATAAVVDDLGETAAVSEPQLAPATYLPIILSARAEHADAPAEYAAIRPATGSSGTAVHRRYPPRIFQKSVAVVALSHALFVPII